MPDPHRRTDLIALFALAALVQGVTHLGVPHTGDFDQAYYLSVARHIASGDGAVIGAVWNHTFLPDTLPYSADVHWMPLPSRLFAMAELVSPQGYRLLGALIAGTWAPLAYVLAGELDLSRRWAVGAGLAAATGTCWMARVAAPDTYGLVGLLGSLALLGVARGHVFRVGLLAALIALARNDGLLFGLALSAGLAQSPNRPRWPAAWPTIAALGGTVAWSARNHWRFGEAYWSTRSSAANHTDYLAWAADVPAEPLSALDRAGLVLAHLPDALAFWLLTGLGIGTVFAAVGLGRERHHGWVVTAGAYWLLLPLIASALAPALAWHGTVYRSGTAVFPALCAIAAAGAHAVNRALVVHRDFAPAALPATSLALIVALATLTGVRSLDRQQREPDPCAHLANVPAGEPVFAYDSLYVELRCRRPTVALFGNTPAERTAELAERYGIRYALTSPRPDHAPPPDTTIGPLAGWSRHGRLAVAPGQSPPAPQ